MDFRQLRTLVAIADHGTFAAAGRAIGLTQSAISLHIKALEEDFRAPLFDRRRRPPMLNAAGRDLVERAREVLDLCDRMRDAMSGNRLSGSIDLGAVPTSLTGILPKALASFQRLHPEIRVRLVSGLSEELAARVRTGELDAAAVSEPPVQRDGTVWHAYARDPLMVIAPIDTTEDDDRAILESHPYIRFNRRTWAGELIARHLTDRRIAVVPGMEIDSLEAISVMVEHGLGVSVIPLPSGKTLPSGVKAIPFGKPVQYRSVGLIERANSPKALLIERLLAELRQAGNTVESGAIPVAATNARRRRRIR